MNWERNLRYALTERGIEGARVDELVSDALAEATAGGVEPESLYGSATVYADEAARALRIPIAPTLPQEAPAGDLLRLSGVTKRYRRRIALHPIDLTVRRGECVAVVGANGAGKSTLLQICAGMVPPTAGRVERPRRVGLVPQLGGTTEYLTADEHFELFGAAERVSGERAVATGRGLAAALGWRPRRRQSAAELSGGTRQKLNVVLGELNRPDLLLLDEPYQGFDQGSYLDLWDQIERWRETGTAVLMVTHLLGELHRVDRVVELAAPQED
ncbi:ATP-binding cassette domain-containing protein [Cumulibacter soli]|uniref:ATP-binding cassette domain-containing protein n=1 Tax=Cumulibacter soli TaxID=2546344 RepID=UPI0014191432|nr:ATP-binding cassette domain-containing protein [Cumulibacter soli]